jgi:hypothetical protein
MRTMTAKTTCDVTSGHDVHGSIDVQFAQGLWLWLSVGLVGTGRRLEQLARRATASLHSFPSLQAVECCQHWVWEDS